MFPSAAEALPISPGLRGRKQQSHERSKLLPIGRIKDLFQRCLSIHEFPGIAGIPIGATYVYFQEFSSIFKGILMQVGKENARNLHTFAFSTGLRPL